MTTPNSPTDAMMLQRLEAMGQAFAAVEMSTMQLLEHKGDYQAETSQALVNEAGNTVTAAINALNQFISEQNAARHASFWSSFFSYFTAAVVIVISVVTAQPELAAVAIITLALQASGGMKWATSQLASVLESCGCSTELSQILAAAVITVALAAAGAGGTIGAARVAAALAARTAATVATETATVVVTETAETVTEEATPGLLSKIAAKLPFRNVSKATAMGIVAGTSAAQGSGLVQYAVEDFVNVLPVSKKLKEALKIALTIVISILLAIAAAGATTGLASSSGKTLFDVAASKGWMIGSRGAQLSGLFFKAAGYIASAAQLGEACSQAVLGATQLKMAQLIREQGEDQAMTNFFNEILGIVNAQASASTSNLSNSLQQTGNAMAAAGRGASYVNIAAARDLCA